MKFAKRRISGEDVCPFCGVGPATITERRDCTRSATCPECRAHWDEDFDIHIKAIHAYYEEGKSTMELASNETIATRSCPICSSTDISADRFKHTQANTYVRKCVCHTCYSTWSDSVEILGSLLNLEISSTTCNRS